MGLPHRVSHHPTYAPEASQLRVFPLFPFGAGEGGEGMRHSLHHIEAENIP